MKRLSFGNKIIFIVNNVFAILLLLSYLTVFISPADFPISGVLNFSIPLLWMLNGLFVIFWLIKLKKQILLSGIIMAIGWFQVQNLFVLPTGETKTENGIKVMSYNVMQFYSLKEKQKSTFQNINDFLKAEAPDVICFQEYKIEKTNLFQDYQFRVINNDSANLKTVILSKYRIINDKHYGFGSSNNSAVFADIVINNDTLRVFSIHFESLNLKQDIQMLQEEPNRRLAKRLSRSFSRQILQIEEIEKDIINSPYPVVLSADMNNTAFSHLYKRITDLGLKDTFVESGEYYGRTFNFFGLPVRIDMIFVDPELRSIHFKNYDVDFSDHKPVMAEIGL